MNTLKCVASDWHTHSCSKLTAIDIISQKMLFSVGLFYIVLNWKVKILGQLPSHFFFGMITVLEFLVRNSWILTGSQPLSVYSVFFYLHAVLWKVFSVFIHFFSLFLSRWQWWGPEVYSEGSPRWSHCCCANWYHLWSGMSGSKLWGSPKDLRREGA